MEVVTADDDGVGHLAGGDDKTLFQKTHDKERGKARAEAPRGQKTHSMLPEPGTIPENALTYLETSKYNGIALYYY